MIRHLHPDALEELQAAALYFDRESPTLSHEFVNMVEMTFLGIEQRPSLGTPLAAGLRRRVVPGFPYSVIYHFTGNRLFIVAVAHQSRKAGYWRDRTSD